MRKIIQIATTNTDQYGLSVVALCDDGELFGWSAESKTWENIIPVGIQDAEGVQEPSESAISAAMAEGNMRGVKSTDAARIVGAYLLAQQPTQETNATIDALRAKVAELEGKLKPKLAPVQGYAQGIPWDMHLDAYNAYCKKYGKQDALIDLEGANCRGGFSTGELDVFIPGWRYKLSTIGQLQQKVAELEDWKARQIEWNRTAVLPL